MTDLTDAARTAYEQYLKGTDTIEEVLSKMIPGSKYHDYLMILDSLKKETNKKGKLPHKIHDQIKKFVKKYKNTTEAKKLDYQSLFIEFDNLADDREQQKKLLEKLGGSKYLSLGLKSRRTVAQTTSEGEKSDADEESRRHALIYSHEDHYKEFLKEIENETHSISKIHPSLVNRINYKNLSDTYFESFLTQYYYISDITHESFLIKAAEYFAQFIKKNKYCNLSDELCKRLTLEQLEKLGELSPELKKENVWNGNIFTKKFYYELDNNNFSNFTLNDRIEQLKRMYKETEGLSDKFRSVILLEILSYGRKLDICYKEYFLEYLKNPASTHCMAENNDIEPYDNTWDQYFIQISSRADSNIYYDYHENLLKYYLEAFHRAGTDLSDYRTYFSNNFYKKTVNDIKFLNGEELNQDEIDMTEYETLGTKVILNILESNPKTFKVDDKIRILCDLKNTPTVYIRLYEFNAENYYRNTLTEFSSEINLDGLEPLVERTEEFKEVPQKKFRHMFEIPEIEKKSGLFIIDLVSNGYSSRAVIKKGSLTLITKQVREGVECYICDENKEICKTIDTALWFQNKYYKADENGKIKVPFSINYNGSNAVLLSNGIADLVYFTQPTEEYYLSCFFTLHHESLLMGKNATMMITPNLQVNGNDCDLSLLNKPEVIITMRSFIDDLPMSKTFDGLDFSRKKDISITFQVPPNLESIEITVSGDVTNITKGICEKKTFSTSYSMNTHKSDTQYFETYLRRINNEYYFYLLGKSGEPVVNADVDRIKLQSLVTGSKEYNEEFSTDKDGKVKLGELGEI